MVGRSGGRAFGQEQHVQRPRVGTSSVSGLPESWWLGEGREDEVGDQINVGPYGLWCYGPLVLV